MKRSRQLAAVYCLSILLTSTLGAIAASPATAQDYVAPRTASGRPDLNGIWQAIGSAHWDIESHGSRNGPVVEMAALGAIPAGLGIVESGEIPYTTAARAHQEYNRDHWLARDPAVRCYMPGVPRATYMPYPFQLVQTPEYVLLAYEFASASRIVYMDRPDFVAPVDAWMGHNIGRWEGETLVIDVTAQVPDTWFDSSGNHHSNQMHVEERYTAISPNHLMYEATITDPETFTRPWTIRLPLYRRIDENMQLLEFKCVEFAEELMYGHLRKDPDLTPVFRATGEGSSRVFGTHGLAFAPPGHIPEATDSSIEIEALVTNLVDAYNNAWLDPVRDAFTADAELELANGTKIEDQDAIATYYRRIFEEYSFEFTIREHDSSPYLGGAYATVVACYELEKRQGPTSIAQTDGQLTVHTAYNADTMRWLLAVVRFTDGACNIERGM